MGTTPPPAPVPAPVPVTTVDADGERTRVNLADFHKLVNVTRNDQRYQEAIAREEGTEPVRLQPYTPALAPVPAPAPTPAPEAIAPAAPQPAPATAPIPAPVPAPAPEPDDTHVALQPDADGRLPQVRIRPKGNVDQMAIILARSQDKSITDLSVINAARAANNLPPLVDATAAPSHAPAPASSAAPQAAPAPAHAPAPVAGTAEIDQQIAALRKERATHQTNFEFEAANELDDKIDQLREQRHTAIQQQQSAQVEAQQTRQREFDEAGARVALSFPALTNPNSELAVLARAKQSAAIQAGDSLAWDPRSVQIFVSEAASELRIAPVLPGAAPAPAPAAAPAPVSVATPVVPTPQPSVRPPGSQILASGGPQAPVSNRPATDGPLQGISTPDDVNKMLAGLTGVQYGGGHRPANR